MARSRKRKTGVLANRRSQRLTQVQKELIVQTHAAVGSIIGTARELGVSQATVAKLVKAAETDHTLQMARSRATEELAGKAHAEAERILASITDEDLTTVVQPTYHANGTFRKHEALGPSLADKTRAFGIMADKAVLLQQARRATLPASSDPADTGVAGLLLPSSIEDARRQILMKAKRLRIVDLEFSQGETGQHIDNIINRANLTQQDVEDAEYVPFGSGPDPFD